MKQIGISPKVAQPALVQALVGALIIFAGSFTHDSKLVAAGGALVAGSGLVGGIGFHAPAGTVEPPEPGVSSDERLSAVARAQIGDPK
jgi:hypothetical protein